MTIASGGHGFKMVTHKAPPEHFIDIGYLITGYVTSAIGDIPTLTTAITPLDRRHELKARWSKKRHTHQVKTGVYAIGEPDEASPVIVTANYKLTLDKVRESLTGQNLWLLIIDTDGINVWCAAGKGSFGTKEIVTKLVDCRINDLVTHRKIILPQLGAPGVKAHLITKATGFRVLYGPVYAKDLPTYIHNGFKKTADMRKIHFTLKERLEVSLIDTHHVLKYIPMLMLLFMALNLPKLVMGQLDFGEIVLAGLTASIPYILGLFISTIVFPALLPYIPGRAFYVKGWLLGCIWMILLISTVNMGASLLLNLGHFLLMTSMIGFLSLNFTGSTTFTSFSGTLKETLIFAPLAAVTSITGLLMILIGQIL